jgi:hypothetical protein
MLACVWTLVLMVGGFFAVLGVLLVGYALLDEFLWSGPERERREMVERMRRAA